MGQHRRALFDMVCVVLSELEYDYTRGECVEVSCTKGNRAVNIKIDAQAEKSQIVIFARTHGLKKAELEKMSVLTVKLNQIVPIGKFVLDVDDFGFKIVFSYGKALNENAFAEAFLSACTMVDIVNPVIDLYLDDKISKEKALNVLYRGIEMDQIGLSDFDEDNEREAQAVFDTAKNVLYKREYKYKENNNAKAILFFAGKRLTYTMLFSVDTINRAYSVICSLGLSIENEPRVARGLCYVSSKCELGGFFIGEENEIYYKADGVYCGARLEEKQLENLIDSCIFECDKYIEGLVALKGNLENEKFFDMD